MIPKILHFIWVGDETKRPDNCIDTWRLHHPDWDIRVWGNDELNQLSWLNRRHMDAMYEREMCGVADLMRWEILYAFGGLAFDADSVCLRPLDDELLDCPVFACWENEIARPGLIANGAMGAEAENPFIGKIITDIAAEASVVYDMAWRTTGPQRLTDTYRKYAYTPMRIYPSHYFLPHHFTGVTYEGRDKVYAKQFWGSTLHMNADLHRIDCEAEQIASASAAA
jgi:mannosyltransferase OCH1-like enzyme